MQVNYVFIDPITVENKAYYYYYYYRAPMQSAAEVELYFNCHKYAVQFSRNQLTDKSTCLECL